MRPLIEVIWNGWKNYTRFCPQEQARVNLLLSVMRAVLWVSAIAVVAHFAVKHW